MTNFLNCPVDILTLICEYLDYGSVTDLLDCGNMELTTKLSLSVRSWAIGLSVPFPNQHTPFLMRCRYIQKLIIEKLIPKHSLHLDLTELPCSVRDFEIDLWAGPLDIRLVFPSSDPPKIGDVVVSKKFIHGLQSLSFWCFTGFDWSFFRDLGPNLLTLKIDYLRVPQSIHPIEFMNVLPKSLTMLYIGKEGSWTKCKVDEMNLPQTIRPNFPPNLTELFLCKESTILAAYELPVSVTKLTILRPRVGRRGDFPWELLPPSLKWLTIDADDDFIPAPLPPHLTYLGIRKRSRILEAEHFGDIPRTLTQLDNVRCSRMTPDSISLLPASLTSANMLFENLPMDGISLLPPGLTELIIDWIDSFHLRHLPPGLLKLTIRHFKRDSDVLDAIFPPRLTSLDLQFVYDPDSQYPQLPPVIYLPLSLQHLVVLSPTETPAVLTSDWFVGMADHLKHLHYLKLSFIISADCFSMLPRSLRKLVGVVRGPMSTTQIAELPPSLTRATIHTGLRTESLESLRKKAVSI